MKIIHAHNHGHKNIGDDAMAINMFNKLRSYDREIKTISTYTPPMGQNLERDYISLTGIIHNYKNPILKIFHVVCARLRLKYLYIMFVWLSCFLAYRGAVSLKAKRKPFWLSAKMARLISGISESDVYLRSGSGSLNDIWFWSSMLPQFTEARIAALFGAKVYFTGQGLGPLSGQYRLKILKKLLNLCSEVSFRDAKESLELSESVADSTHNLRCFGDDALDFPIATPEPSWGEKLASNSRIIICQFRPTDYETRYSNSFWLDLAKQLSHIVSTLQDVKVVFVSFSNGKLSDLDAARETAKYMNEQEYEICEKELTPEEARWIMSRATLAIGQSYHFGVFALGENIPFVGIYQNEYYRMKLKGLLEWYDVDELALHISKLAELSNVSLNAIDDAARLSIICKDVNKRMTTRQTELLQRAAQ